MPGPEGATIYRPGPTIDASQPPPPSSPKDTEPVAPPPPKFDIEQAGMSAAFLEIQGETLRRHGIDPLSVDTVDAIYNAAGDSILPNKDLREERQAKALEALYDICGLDQSLFEAWIAQQPTAIQIIASLGRTLRNTSISYGDQEDSNLLLEMANGMRARADVLKNSKVNTKSAGKTH